jgi:hypothetical protein
MCGVLKIPIHSVTIYEIQEELVYGGEFHVSMQLIASYYSDNVNI